MFLTFEGMEGCGKSTQCKKLIEYFVRQGHDVLHTLEPGGSRLGKELRRILLDPKNSDLSSTSELFLYLADRAQHVSSVIRPAMEDGRTVICDRFADSTVVYQGYGRGLDPSLLHHLNDVAVQGLWPDITILLDIEPEIGLKRALTRNMQDNKAATEGRFEAESMAFHTRIREGYLTWAALHRSRFLIVDASQGPDAVFDSILRGLEEKKALAKPEVTGLVLTLNGAKHLGACLASLDFCDRILVVDSGSTDATADIAAAHGAHVLVNPWPGPKKQFEFAFTHITTPWVVSLDQDEILSDELRASVIQALQDPGDMSAFLCPRTSYYFDRFLRHSGWYPDLLPRVFKLADTGVHVSGPHYGFETKGKIRRLAGDIIHYPYENLKQHVEKINYYTQIAADEMHAKGKRAGVATAVAHGLARFMKIYFFRRGFLDGKAGFVLAVNSFFYAFQKYIRLAELTLKDKNGA